MDSKLVNRNEWAAYMKTADSAYTLMGEGFTSLTENKNAKEYSRQYVHEKTERTDVTGYATSIAYSCDVYSEDPVIQKIIEITDNEKVGTDAQVEVVSVNLWQTGGAENSYIAYQRKYAVIPDSKGDGTDALVYSGNLRAVGDVVKGKFTVSDGAGSFTADA